MKEMAKTSQISILVLPCVDSLYHSLFKIYSYIHTVKVRFDCFTSKYSNLMEYCVLVTGNLIAKKLNAKVPRIVLKLKVDSRTENRLVVLE